MVRVAASSEILREVTAREDDHRRNRVTITAARRAALRGLDGAAARAQDQLLAPLSDADRAELTALLRYLLAHHGLAICFGPSRWIAR